MCCFAPFAVAYHFVTKDPDDKGDAQPKKQDFGRELCLSLPYTRTPADPTTRLYQSAHFRMSLHPPSTRSLQQQTRPLPSCQKPRSSRPARP